MHVECLILFCVFTFHVHDMQELCAYALYPVYYVIFIAHLAVITCFIVHAKMNQ